MKIFLAMNSDILTATIQQIFSNPGTQDFVATAAEADVIIFDSFELITGGFDDSKLYGFVGITGYIPDYPYRGQCKLVKPEIPSDLPSNVRMIRQHEMLKDIIAVFYLHNLKPKTE